jgi:Tfp pilus assembly protein PilF
LGEALRIFQSCQSQPFAFAGVAYTLLTAAREEDGRYAPLGLEAAQGWLEKAQELAPDELDINTIEPFIYVFGGQHENARTVLDYLLEQDAGSHRLLEADALYWQGVGEFESAEHSFKQAIAATDTVPQKLRLQTKLGELYLAFGRYQQAAEVLGQVVYFDPQNAWLWHLQSMAYLKMKRYEEAGQANRRALAIKDFPAARQMTVTIREKGGFDTGRLGRLFGR